MGFGATSFPLNLIDPTINHLGRGHQQFDLQYFPPGIGTADLEDKRAPHLTLHVVSAPTTVRHRNVPCRKASLFFKDRSQGPPSVGTNCRPSLRGSFRKGVRYMCSSPSTPFGVPLRPSPPCLLPSRLLARARSCWNQVTPPPPPGS